MSKELIAFYSRADENYISGTLKNLSVGNTEIVAETIRDLTGADLFKIEQVVAYSESYNICIEEARTDKQKNVRPKLKNCISSIDEYDVIYLGFPNYWCTMPMAVFTFLENFDFSNKIIKPFCTHEGSGMGNSIDDIKKTCPFAVVESGLALYGSRVSREKSSIKEWLG